MSGTVAEKPQAPPLPANDFPRLIAGKQQDARRRSAGRMSYFCSETAETSSSRLALKISRTADSYSREGVWTAMR